MTQYQNELCAGNLGGEFHAAQNVSILEVTGDARYEDVANPEVEYVLDGDPGINTRQDDRLGKLSSCCLPDLRGVVPARERSRHEALIAGSQKLRHLFGRKGFLLVLR
jgi:hypothetical protein